MHKRSGLGHEGDVAGIGSALVERGVEADGRAHDAQAVRTDEADLVTACGFHQFFFQCDAGRSCLAETGGDDDRRLHAVEAAFFDDARHGLRRRGDHHQFHLFADLGDGCVSALALYLRMLGVDRIQRALETALQHVLEHDLADRVGTVAGAEHGDGLGCEQGIEVVLAHDIALPLDGLLV